MGCLILKLNDCSMDLQLSTFYITTKQDTKNFYSVTYLVDYHIREDNSPSSY